MLAQLQDALGDEARLHVLVLRANQQRAEFAAALGRQHLGVFVGGARDDLVGDVEDALQRAIVLFELDHARAGEDFRKVHDVAEVGAAKRIDRLRIVAHRHHVAMGRGEQPHQLGLDQVGVLVLVDHDVAVGVAEAPAHVVVLLEQLGQPVEQVVVVEQSALALVGVVGGGQPHQVVAMLDEMRKVDLDLLAQLAALVARHADRFGDGALLGKAPIARAQAHPRPQQVDDVFHVGAVEDGEVRLEPDRGAELAQRQVGEGVKGAAGHRARAIAHQVLDPPQHLLRRAPGKGQQQNRARRDAAFDEPRDPVNQRASLARAGAGDHQDRSVAMSHGGELRGIEQLGVLDAEAALVNLFARGAQYDHFVGHGVTILPRRGAMSFR